MQRLEQIDKENFGLKLKIHFLEENLKKMGPEFNRQAMEENINLKSEKVTMARDIKNYSKDLKAAEKELDTYKQQLREYAEKVKRRHVDEGMREEMDELRRLADERADEVERLERKLEEYHGNLARAAVELAKEWRSDKVLRKLEAMMIVMNAEKLFLISGTGEVIEPDDGMLAIGSGGSFALSAGRALKRYAPHLSAKEIAEAALTIASEVCVFTNNQILVEEVS